MAAERSGGFGSVWPAPPPLVFSGCRVCGLLTAAASLAVDHRGLLGREAFGSCGFQDSWPPWHVGVVPDQGWSPCLLHWQAASSLPGHHGRCSLLFRDPDYTVTWPGDLNNKSRARFSIQDISFQCICHSKPVVHGPRAPVSLWRGGKCRILGPLLQIHRVRISVVPDCLRPHRLSPARLLCLWDSPGKNTAVGCHVLLRGIFPTQGSNLRLLHWRADSLAPDPSLFSCSVVSDSATPWSAARQASLSITNSRSLLNLMSIESVMPSSHLILCGPLLLPPSIFPSIRIFSKESVLHIRWPEYWSFSFSISPSNEYSQIRICTVPRPLGDSKEHWDFRSTDVVRFLISICYGVFSLQSMTHNTVSPEISKLCFYFKNLLPGSPSTETFSPHPQHLLHMTERHSLCIFILFLDLFNRRLPPQTV